MHRKAAEHGMCLNTNKCRELIVNFLQYLPFAINEVQLMGTVIKRVSGCETLGVYFSYDFSMEYTYELLGSLRHPESL